MNIITIDTETTGVDVANDAVVELCIQYGLEDATGHAEAPVVGLWRFRPWKLIPEAATKIHGITNEDVAPLEPFGSCANEIADALEGADVIIGYNVDFDLQILDAEFHRIIGGPRPKLGAHIVDALALWRAMEPRTLKDAYRTFVGGAFMNAHAADADVAATAQVAIGMIHKFGLADKSWEEIAALASPERSRFIGGTKHFQWNDAGEIVCTFGKNKGMLLTQIDKGFLRWVIGKDFPVSVKKICQLGLTNTHSKMFYAAVLALYPRKEITP